MMIWTDCIEHDVEFAVNIQLKVLPVNMQAKLDQQSQNAWKCMNDKRTILRTDESTWPHFSKLLKQPKQHHISTPQHQHTLKVQNNDAG